jgi:UDP-N-acetylglucosamine transferase subunit ALG13
VRILLTIGSQPYPFDRVVKATDEWAAAHPEHEVIMQISHCTYRPTHAARQFALMELEAFQGLFASADVVISHASSGPVLMARRSGIPLVVVPRQTQFGESFNDHQVHFSEAIRGASQMQEFVLDIRDLGPAVDRALERRRRGQTYEPRVLRDRLIAAIAAFVERVARG